MSRYTEEMYTFSPSIVTDAVAQSLPERSGWKTRPKAGEA
jgi:hypothetical protein